MKKIAFALVGFVCCPLMSFADLPLGRITGESGVSFVRDLGTIDGKQVYREIYSDGVIQYRGMDGSYVKGGNFINQSSALAKAPSSPSTALANTTKNSSTALAKTTSSPSTALAKPASTGTPNVPDAPVKPATGAPKMPAAPAGGAGGTGGAGGAGTGAAAAAGATNVLGVVTGVAGVVAGSAMVYDATSEKDRKTNLADFLEGTAGGAVAGSSAALVFNSIPVAGQIAYGAATVTGAVLGAGVVGVKIFSETDCALDEVLSANKNFDVYQCCHTSQKLSKITHANYVDIGAYMFCRQPGFVSQCIQQQYVTGNVNKSSDVDKISWDDKWSSCRERWCGKKPAKGVKVQYYADYDNYCWNWECAEPGYVKKGDTCVKSAKQCNYNGKKYNLGAVMETKACSGLSGETFADLRTGQTCKVVCSEEVATAKNIAVWSIETCPSGKKGVALSNPNKYSPAVTGYKKCISDALSCKASRSTEEGKACCDLPNSVAEWKAPHCVCTDSNLEFKIVNGKGKCVAKQSCESLYKGNARAIACCNSTEATWDAINNVCLCNDETKNWDYNQNKCVDGEGDDGSVTPIPSDDKVCYYSFVGDVKCANENSYNINKQIPVNNTSSQDCETFLKTYEADRNNILKIQQEICAKQGSYFIVINQAQIDAAQSKISSFFNTAESTASVWKDSEGKFNTARLASDLTAGVVLGTVGGVVSGVVIKKKQVEKGFEALHCTVGGQPIADWGDTFNVGLR